MTKERLRVGEGVITPWDPNTGSPALLPLNTGVGVGDTASQFLPLLSYTPK